MGVLGLGPLLRPRPHSSVLLVLLDRRPNGLYSWLPCGFREICLPTLTRFCLTLDSTCSFRACMFNPGYLWVIWPGHMQLSLLNAALQLPPPSSALGHMSPSRQIPPPSYDLPQKHCLACGLLRSGLALGCRWLTLLTTEGIVASDLDTSNPLLCKAHVAGHPQCHSFKSECRHSWALKLAA